MEHVKRRVDEVRRTLGMTQAAFADSIGMTQSGYATLIRREGPKVRKGKALKTLALAIEAAHGFRHQWLLTGEGERRTGEAERLNDAEQTLLHLVFDGRFVSLEDRNEAIFNLVRAAIQGRLLSDYLRYTSMIEMFERRGAVSKGTLKEMQRNLNESSNLRSKYFGKLLRFRERLGEEVDFFVLLLDLFARWQRLDYRPLKLLEDDPGYRVMEKASGELSKLLDQARRLVTPDDELQKIFEDVSLLRS